MIRRKNHTVIFQWEPFSGALGQEGISYLELTQNIYNLPPHPLEFPIRIVFKGTGQPGYLAVDPSSAINIRFHLSMNNSNNTHIGDSIAIPGGSVSWITQQ